MPSQQLVCNPPITLDQREASLLAIIDQISDPVLVDTPGTPQNVATDWLINVDGAQVCPEDSTEVVNRYVLAVLYFSTDGDEWTLCNAASSPNPNLCQNAERFLSPASECSWFNVDCDFSGNILGVDLGTWFFVLYEFWSLHDN